MSDSRDAVPPHRPLPPRPSLEQQRKLAKELLSAFRADDPDARRRIRAHLPHKPRIALADAQFTLAREYGFASWRALKTHIAAARTVVGSSGAVGPSKASTAEDPLPSALRDAFCRAFEARDIPAIRELFARQSAAETMIDAPLFPFGTPAIVLAADANDLALVELLLEFGADPNRRTDWWAGGFHALHVVRDQKVAARLVDAGAVADACAAAHLDRPDLLARLLDEDPSRVHERGGDGKMPLHFARSRLVADLLIDRGADLDARDVDHRSTPAQWMLEARRDAGRYALARHLVERGASADIFLASALGLVDHLRRLLDDDPALIERRTHQGEYAERPPSSYHIYTWTIGQNMSPLQVAAQFEQQAALDLLRRFADPRTRFLAACAIPDAREAEQLLREFPALVDELTTEDQRALPDAGWNGNADAVTLMLKLGFDPATPGQESGTVLHCAAWHGWTDCVEAVLRDSRAAALVAGRDRIHGSTPLGWCCHGAVHSRNPAGDYVAVARLLIQTGARPDPDLEVPPALMAVIHGAT